MVKKKKSNERTKWMDEWTDGGEWDEAPGTRRIDIYSIYYTQKKKKHGMRRERGFQTGELIAFNGVVPSPASLLFYLRRYKSVGVAI